MPLPKPVLTIRVKLILLIILAIGLAQGLLGAVLLWQEVRRYGDTKQETLLATGQILAAASAQATAERNGRAVASALRAIGRIKGLSYVGVDDAQGRHLIDLGSTEQLAGDIVLTDTSEPISIFALLTSRSIEVDVPVVEKGSEVGRLTLVSDTRDLGTQIDAALRTTFIGLLIALAVGLLVALRLQARITGPLRQLATAMARVSGHHDYSVSLTPSTRDEVGVLVTGFNDMIVGIRQRDDKLSKHREHLEQEVTDRTRDLNVAKDAAETANVQKSEFLATMSHEIRTPMNGILVMAEMLASADLPARTRRYADVIAQSGQSLLAIINDILDFSKVEAGKLELEPLHIDPVTCTDMVLSLFFERARSKGLDLVAFVSPDVPATIEADPVRLNQVLGNLVNNALKFTETGGVRLSIEPDEAHPRYLRFSVTDTGIGIPPEKCETIFAAFSQADQSTTRRYGGTGLGLSISQKLVQAMGSRIEVTSRLGEGSTFSFSLACCGDWSTGDRWPRVNGTALAPIAVVGIEAPLTAAVVEAYLARAGFSVRRQSEAAAFATADLVIADSKILRQAAVETSIRHGKILALAPMGESDGEFCVRQQLADGLLTSPLLRHDLEAALDAIVNNRPLPSAKASAPSDSTFPNLAHAKLLVADDSAVNREVAIEALRRFGIVPDLVENGAAAFDACQARSYDLVLMDGSMPVMDGFEAARRIRAHEGATGTRTVPIVALTAHVVGAGADAWKQAGMNDVLHKPFTLSGLRDVLLHYLVPNEARVEKPEPAAIPVDETGGAPTQDENPVIDATALAQVTATGSPDFFERIVTLYRQHAPQSIAEMRAGFAAQDLEQTARAAHALKSMSLNIGARRVAAAAAEIETACRQHRRSPARETIDCFDHLLREALDALDLVRRSATQAAA